MRYTTIDSPVGELLLFGDDDGLHGVHMERQRHMRPRDPAWRHDPEALADPATQLQEYFAGERTEFELELAPHGTPFQLRVWELLRGIPFGETTTYGALATTLGRPDRSRAVGAANGRNPISIIVPCHRVIGADGALVGYGGGLDRKRALLAHEAARRARTLRGCSDPRGAGAAALTAKEPVPRRRIALTCARPPASRSSSTAASCSCSSPAYLLASTEFDLPPGPPLVAAGSVALAYAAMQPPRAPAALTRTRA